MPYMTAFSHSFTDSNSSVIRYRSGGHDAVLKRKKPTVNKIKKRRQSTQIYVNISGSGNNITCMIMEIYFMGDDGGCSIRITVQILGPSSQTGITDRPIISLGNPHLSLFLFPPLPLLPLSGLLFNYGLIISYLIYITVKATHFLSPFLFISLKSLHFSFFNIKQIINFYFPHH